MNLTLANIVFVLSQLLLFFLPVVGGLIGLVLERFLTNLGLSFGQGWIRPLFVGLTVPTYGSRSTHGLEPVLSVFLRHATGLRIDPAGLLVALVSLLVAGGLVRAYLTGMLTPSSGGPA